MSEALSAWRIAPLVDAALIASAACYLTGAWRVGRRHPPRPWPATRTAAFCAGATTLKLCRLRYVGSAHDWQFAIYRD